MGRVLRLCVGADTLRWKVFRDVAVSGRSLAVLIVWREVAELSLLLRVVPLVGRDEPDLVTAVPGRDGLAEAATVALAEKGRGGVEDTLPSSLT